VRIVRLLATPGRLAALVTIVAIVVVEWSAAGIVTGLAGAIVGLLAILAASQVGLLVSVPLVGMRVQRVVVGIGPRLGDWSRPDRTLTVRAIPIILAVGVRATRAPVRRRMWWSALCSALAELAVVMLAAASVAGGGAFAHGFAIACVAEFVHAMLPSRSAAGTSTGWLLFQLPFVSSEHARQLEAAPLVGEAIDAARGGDLAAAERLAIALREAYPDLRTALSARMSVLEAQGRYAEAMILAVKLASDARQEPDEAAGSFAALAGLACVTVEAGQLDSELGLSTASQALENATTLGYPSYKLNGVRALIELLRGNLDEAIALATRAADAGDSLLGRADDLATLARAHMASGDNQTARQVLTEAEKLASWWPRVASTRSRLEVC
jgi:tetratricopeptide (TPR) repeat protein